MRSLDSSGNWLARVRSKLGTVKCSQNGYFRGANGYPLDSLAEVNEKSGKSGQAGRGGTSLLPEEVKGGYESAARNWEIGDGAYYDTRDYYDLGRERYRGPMGASALQRSVQDLQVILSSS